MLYPPGRVWPEAAAKSVHMTNYLNLVAARHINIAED
jgi:hypothetical protein